MSQDITNIIEFVLAIYLNLFKLFFKQFIKFKNPIKRLLAKYFYDIPERAYEEHLHFLYKEQCNQKMR